MKGSIRILIIEDNDDDAELLLLKLKKAGYSLSYEIVLDEESMKAALEGGQWDAIISDYRLPSFNALAALEIAQKHDPDIPFIVVSGTIGEETAVEAMKAGAHDYVMKSNLARLIPALDREVREAEIRRRRRESEVLLHQQETLMRSVVDMLPVGVGLVNNNHEIIIANRAFKKIWGNVNRLDEKELSNFKGWWADTGEQINPGDWSLLRALKNGETTMDKMTDIVCHDGTRRTILNSAIPVYGENHVISSAVIVSQDITKIMQDEAKLKKTLSDLERSNHELEQFAYVASHDLQEPLRMVASFTQLLEIKYKGKLDKQADEYIGFAVEGAKRMQRIIRDLLDFSRITNNQQYGRVDMNEILNSVLLDLSVLINESGAVITSSGLPVVNASDTQLKQLLQNLITNAIKFHGENFPEIKVEAYTLGNEWVFNIKDNGIGIDPQFSEKIFTIFQRLHNREEYPGTGIGLALCKKIVESYGGRIWVESKPGMGSTFYFTLPVQPVTES
ncbi:MAG: sensor histidine kinase [Ignavibacteriales bacterium]